MELHETAVRLALAFLGDLSEEMQAALDQLCRAAEQQLQTRLRPGLSPADCEACFTCAAAWMAMAALLQGRDSDGISTFAASDLSVTCRGSGGADLKRQAEEIMGPYLDDGFAFLGVRA